MSKSPLDSMIASAVSCTVCGAKGIGTCLCWERCSCGRTVLTKSGARLCGQKPGCDNPIHEWGDRPVCPGCGHRSTTALSDGSLACLEFCGAVWDGTAAEVRKAKRADMGSERELDAHMSTMADVVSDARKLAAMSPKTRETNARMAERATVEPEPVEQLSLIDGVDQ